jgi:hypothetical protein
MKQTAVEWLVDEYFGGIENCTPDFRFHIQQAKEMEKEQIETAFEEGMFHHTNGLCPDEYYNETFKTE